MAKIFVTGGAGYIGSHTVLELLQKNHAVTVIDNLENSSLHNLEQVKKMSGRDITFIEGDLRDFNKLNELLSE
ncbi:MAG TPA: SDR family NAD(P)-dependent oxidoreductase, partial [Candidatus Dojkabacteria bacterium]|nr:SDR family NAD(P)-dependent oxidoreductase [Candidatus Dojkabacteria bacterium]